MKLDLELVVAVLQFVEENQINDRWLSASSIVIAGRSQEDVFYTIRILIDEELILVSLGDTARLTGLSSGAMNQVNIMRLTGAGHGFLGNARVLANLEDTAASASDGKGVTRWQKFKEVARGLPLRVVNTLLDKSVLLLVQKVLGL